MNWKLWVLIPLFSLLILAVLPFSIGQVFALRVIRRLWDITLLIGIVVCLVFSCDHSCVPNCLCPSIRLLIVPLREQLPGFAAAEQLWGTPWPPLAILLTFAGLIYRLHLSAMIRWATKTSSPCPHQNKCASNATQPIGPRLLKHLMDSED